MGFSTTRRALISRCCRAAPLALLPVVLPGCGGAGASATPIAPSPPGGGQPPDPGPLPPLTPPSSTGVVTAVAAVESTPTADGLQLRVSAMSPLADVWGHARTLVEHAGIVRYVLVMRTGNDVFTALNAICTHEGCIVSGIDGAVFVCPCHGSRYDHTGAVVRGPAPAALPRLTTAFSGDILTVRLS